MPFAVFIGVDEPFSSSWLPPADEIVLLVRIVNLAQPIENPRPLLVILSPAQTVDTLFRLEYGLAGEISISCQSEIKRYF